MPQVSYDVVREKGLTIVVPIEPPWIGGAVGDHFEILAYGVIAPDRTIQQGAFVVGRARFTYERIVENAMPPVEPAIGPPGQSIDHVVAGFERPAIQNHFGLAVGQVVPVAVGNKNE